MLPGLAVCAHVCTRYGGVAVADEIHWFLNVRLSTHLGRRMLICC